MNVLVTGGSGYLGSAIVRALVRGGHEPIVFARGATTAGLPGRAVDGDIRDTRAVTDAARGVDAICHAAALVALWRRDPSEFDAVNVGGLQSALSAARAQGVPRIVYTSSFLALPPADSHRPLTANHYQRTKVAARDVARRAAAEGSPIITLYPGVIYGPGPATEGNLVGRLVRDHLSGRVPGLVGADRLWSFSYVDDVADAHVAAMTGARLRGEYAVGGVNAPQMAIFEFLRETRGCPLPRRIPDQIALLGGAAMEAWARLSGRPPVLTRGAADILRHDWPLDSTAARADLGLGETPLAEGLRQVVPA